MSEPIASTATAKPPGTVYTFYSYKGGVGRSMALANVGVLLATAGKRVLLVDWDLEAPGLEAYFSGAAKLVGDPATAAGIVDLLEAHAEGGTPDWREGLLHAEFFGQSLDILSAGRRSEGYRRRVQQLDWVSLYEEHRIGNFVNQLRNEWRDVYDVVLIDSRTGITDIGDICTVLLPDVVVLLFVTNYQNINGIRDMMARAVRARSKLPIHRSKLLGVPVPARDERDREYQKSVEWQQTFAREFGDLYREWLPKDVQPADALNKLFIPYVAGWSFGECIPVLESERERSDPTSLGAAYARLATLLSHRLDWSAIDAKVTSGELVGTRLELSKARDEARAAEERLSEIEAERRLREIEAEIEKEASRRKRRRWIWVLVLLLLLYPGYRVYTKLWPTHAQLLQRLSDEVPEVRLDAIGRLYLTTTDPKEKQLLATRSAEFLKDKDATVRANAADYLGYVDDAGTFAPNLAALLKDSDYWVRYHAVSGLVRLGTRAAPYAPDIANLLDDEFSLTRAQAAEALGNMGPEGARFAPQISPLLKEEDDYVRKAAEEAFKKLQPLVPPPAPKVSDPPK
jgi:cellulose biosynthesis protein BcsQ